jgi:hypothetical protein
MKKISIIKIKEKLITHKIKKKQNNLDRIYKKKKIK